MDQVTCIINHLTSYLALGFFNFSRSAAWIFFSSSTLLFAPLLLEIERTQMQAAQLNQQKQVLIIKYFEVRLS